MTDRCADCPPAALSWARAAFLYQGPVRQAVMRLKFGGSRAVAEGLAPAMAVALASWMTGWDARSPPGVPLDGGFVITWVPLGRHRRRERGFDQAEVLARSAATALGLPARPLLRRVVETGPQARRNLEERRLALHGAFLARRASPGRVILIDDVLTTGATAASCARVLREAGAKEVGLLTAARSLGGPVPARCYNPDVLLPGSVVARETLSR